MLCDSNILIYAVHPSDTLCKDFIASRGIAIASVTRIGVLGYPGFRDMSETSKQRLRDLLLSLKSLDLTESVIDRAIQMRQQRLMGLADAIVAGTALVHDMELATRNIADFKNIPGLRQVNPYADPS
ncbi:MAG: type II toxin-antitoxin system VapC family toxin [Candidatus Hydrogenedentes bacterium]|nr:type II toxin-antitoxin system VapC family toxin [Candidatus Hydrogenedentota bacterium]